MGYGGFILDGGGDVASEVRVAACKLVCKGGEDVLELSSVEVISGTEKASPKGSLTGNQL